MSKLRPILVPRMRLTRPGPLDAGGSLGRALSAHYAGVPAEPLPAAFDMLLKRLEAREGVRATLLPPEPAPSPGE